MEAWHSRRAWQLLEAFNAVTYFSPECREGPERLGLRGFWMGYFSGRAAPMGAAPPALVEATFYNFHPAMVRRALPDAWARAAPEDVVAVRSAGAAAALRRLAPDVEEAASRLLPVLRRVIEHGSVAGRPLFAANREVTTTGAVEGLWQAATTLREHRGDGHVAVLTGADLDGCEVHVLFSATEHVPPHVLQDARGWSTSEWAGAVDRLRSRGLLGSGGAPTPAGRRLHRDIERRTDDLALAPYRVLDEDEFGDMVALLGTVARDVHLSGEIPFPNPIGLPEPDGRW